MKKIVCLIDDLCPGGAQRQLVGLAYLLNYSGYDISVMTYHNDSFYMPVLSDNGIPHVYDSSFESPLRRIPLIASRIKKMAPDVVIAYQESPSLIACCSKLLSGRFKLIVSERNTTQYIGMNERLRFFLYKFADTIVPNSHSQEAFLRTHYPAFDKNICTITNFVDTDKFIQDNSIKKINRIVSVGRITPQKNILNYIRGAHQVIEKGFDITFDWYGNTDTPEYETNCHNLIRDLHMDDRFVFHQATNDIIPEYQKSLAFCLPSIYEGFPNVVCEAMSCGVPVLCSNVCDNPNIITSDKYGFLFDPNNVDDIANAFFRFLRLSSNHINKMGNDCRDTAIRMFSKQIFVKKYIEIIESE